MNAKQVEHFLIDNNFDYEDGCWLRKFAGSRSIVITDKYVQSDPNDAYDYITKELKWRKQS